MLHMPYATRIPSYCGAVLPGILPCVTLFTKMILLYELCVRVNSFLLPCYIKPK